MTHLKLNSKQNGYTAFHTICDDESSINAEKWLNYYNWIRAANICTHISSKLVQSCANFRWLKRNCIPVMNEIFFSGYSRQSKTNSFAWSLTPTVTWQTRNHKWSKEADPSQVTRIAVMKYVQLIQWELGPLLVNSTHLHKFTSYTSG